MNHMDIKSLKAEECHYPNIIAEMQERDIDFEKMADIMKLKSAELTADILVLGKNTKKFKAENLLNMLEVFEQSPNYYIRRKRENLA